MQISACRESPSDLALLQGCSELQTSVSLLSLRAILVKSTLVHIAPLPAARAESQLIPVALGSRRGSVPVWKVSACGGCPALCSDRGHGAGMGSW